MTLLVWRPSLYNGVMYQETHGKLEILQAKHMPDTTYLDTVT